MHRCLQIPEIASLICKIGFRDNRNGILALAQTCKLLYEPAAHVIWHTIPSLKPLADCISQDIWDDVENDEANTLKPFQQIDLARCRDLGKRVYILGRDVQLDTRLDEGHPTFNLTDAQYRAFLFATAGATLLPNLHDVRIVEPDSAALTFAHLFTHSNLKTLRIHLIANNCFRSYLHDFLGFLRAAGQRYPLLEHFELAMHNLADGFAVVNNIENIIRDVAWKNLRCLRLRVNNSIQMVAHLRKYPLLQEVDIEISKLETESYLFHQQMPPLLPQVQQLTLAIPDISFAINFLRQLSPGKRPLRDLALWIISPRRSSSARWADLTQCLMEQCSSDTLEALSIDDTDDHTDPPDTQSLPQYHVSIDHMNTLLAFKALTALRICTYGILDFDDIFFGKMVRSWPKLQELRIYGQHISNYPPKLTSQSLVELAEHCPNLRTLSLPFKADAPTASKPGARARFGRTLKELDVLYSPVSEPARMAAFLADLFPGLTTLLWGLEGFDDEYDPPLWEQVEELLPIFVEARSDELARCERRCRTRHQD